MYESSCRSFNLLVMVRFELDGWLLHGIIVLSFLLQASVRLFSLSRSVLREMVSQVLLFEYSFYEVGEQ